MVDEMLKFSNRAIIVHTVISRILAGHYSCVCIMLATFMYIRMILLWNLIVVSITLSVMS